MTHTYKVAVFCEVLLSRDDGVASALFFREIEMPFPPSVGLSINISGEWFCGPFEHVEWHSAGFFVCYVKPRDSLIADYALERDRPVKEELFEHMLSFGWLRFGRAHDRPSFFAPLDAA